MSLDVSAAQILHKSAAEFLKSCWSSVYIGIQKKLDLLLVVATGRINLLVRVRASKPEAMFSFSIAFYVDCH